MKTTMNKYACILLLLLAIPLYGQDTALFDALIQNNVRSSEYLIQRSSDLTATNKEGMTYLHLVSDPKLALLLIEKGADITATNRRGNTPLHWAVSKGKLDIAQVLIDNGADINAVDNFGNSPLHASVHVSENIMLLLLQSNADVNITNKKGDVPLISALQLGSPIHAKYLILAGANDIANKAGLKPSMLESIVTKEALKETLMIGLLPFPIITEIFKGNYPGAIDMIEELEYIDEVDLDGNTVLHWAFKVKNYEIAEALILKEPNYNEFNNNDETPIDTLLETGDDEFINYMKNFLQENTDYDATVYTKVNIHKPNIVFY